ncbi:MAG: hypothetical protein ACHQRM_12265 [Bacteroidia bacterium]
MVYKNIYAYRLVMNLLYTGTYTKRFRAITALLNEMQPASVFELCFGDIQVASYCREHGIKWTGWDINTGFVKYAIRKGYNAEVHNVTDGTLFPESEVCIIAGSLYHFQEDGLKPMLENIFNSTTKLIISEPVLNLSASQGLLGHMARRFSTTKLGEVPFRYNKESLLKALDKLAAPLAFRYRVVCDYKKDLVIMAEKSEAGL